LFDWFDKAKEQRISKSVFFEKTFDTGFCGFDREVLNEVFHYIDHNKNEEISLKEFKYHFYEREYLEKEFENQPSEFEEELKLLFSKIDTHKTGNITCDDFIKCLNYLGYPSTPQMIQLQFEEIDLNQDNMINYPEFKRFMAKTLRSSIFKIDHLLDEVRSKLHRVHPGDGQNYTLVQFGAGLRAINKDYTDEEINTLFLEIDEERIGTAHIDDILRVIRRPPDEFDDHVLHNSILKLKKNRMVSLTDLSTIFVDLPKNFCNSFTRFNFMNLKNLPSDSLYPKLESNGMGYLDVSEPYYDQRTKRNYPLRPLNVFLTRKIVIELGKGIPLPERPKNVGEGEKIRARELRVVLFNRDTQKFVGSTHTFRATWTLDYEDRWTFDEKECAFYLRAGETSSLCVILEFVVYFECKNIELQMSCGWCGFDLDNMVKPGVVDLPLFGGSPMVNTKILEADVRTGRGTFFGKVGKFFQGRIKSELQLRVVMEEKLPEPVKVESINEGRSVNAAI
jgi:Ca2+-binding EF-hand superfamily protein